jgi:hypothetical protein
MGDRRNPSIRLGAPLSTQPAVVDWPSYFAQRQAQMNHFSIDPNPQIPETQASFYNWTPSLQPPMHPNQGTQPHLFVYYPPRLPKEWDLSFTRFQLPGPGDLGECPGGPFFSENNIIGSYQQQASPNNVSRARGPVPSSSSTSAAANRQAPATSKAGYDGGAAGKLEKSA